MASCFGCLHTCRALWHLALARCCLCAIAQASLEAIALEVDVLGGRREQGGEFMGGGELVEMSDLQRGFGSGMELCPKCRGPGGADRAAGMAGAGLALGRERGFCVPWEQEKGGKSLFLPSDLSLAGSVAWEGGSRVEGCYMGCQGTRMAQWMAG